MYQYAAQQYIYALPTLEASCAAVGVNLVAAIQAHRSVTQNMNTREQCRPDLASVIKSMHRFHDPSQRLQDLLVPSGSFPAYICASISQDSNSCGPLSWIYEHVIHETAAEGDGEGNAIRVVCKVATSAEGKGWLVKEAKFYECHAAPLLGRNIPRYFGIFQTPTQPEDDVATRAKALCLVLEHGGKHLPRTYEDGIRDQTLRFQ